MAASIEALMKRVAADVEALGAAIQADESEDQSGVREEMGKLHKLFKDVIVKARTYSDRAHKLAERADKEREITQGFNESVDNLLVSLESAAEAVDPEQWDWDGEAT